MRDWAEFTTKCSINLQDDSLLAWHEEEEEEEEGEEEKKVSDTFNLL